MLISLDNITQLAQGSGSHKIMVLCNLIKKILYTNDKIQLDIIGSQFQCFIDALKYDIHQYKVFLKIRELEAEESLERYSLKISLEKEGYIVEEKVNLQLRVLNIAYIIQSARELEGFKPLHLPELARLLFLLINYKGS